MTEEEKLQTLLSRAYFYLQFRPRTVSEMETYLINKAEKYRYSPGLVNKALSHLQENKYLDDSAFIESWVYSRSQNQPRGEFVLKQELYQKGVPHQTVEEYFFNHPINEEKLAAAALEKAWSRYTQLPRLERRKKASDYLQRRGFRYDVITKAIEQKEKKE